MEASAFEQKSSPSFSTQASTCSASSATSSSSAAQTPNSSFRSEMPSKDAVIEEGRVQLSVALGKLELDLQNGQEPVHYVSTKAYTSPALTSKSRRTHGLGLDAELDRDEEEKADTFNLAPIGLAFGRPSLAQSTSSVADSIAAASQTSLPASSLAQYESVSLLAPASSSSPSRQAISPPSSLRGSPLSKDFDRPKRGSFLGMSAFRSKKEKPISPLSAPTSSSQNDWMSHRQGSSAAGSIRSRSSADLGSQNRDCLPKFPASRNSLMQYQK